ncbi:retinol dehydrogenase 10-B [Microplitis demolitor]|uniref:retinol dehydrogenase 10-B n=1 Tax=Microplitis demolitor TaxID=69319 RepID=UPI0004CD15C5|nr:retinol dehydrogenase 10-B [Microplitis demolitor]XP_008544720.1 retinol dehydrogenase 10-B [Microplitis demolitor]XP_008544721.1 retinol dehydrogenase 10-B [Microplitis demolitor]
MVPMKEEVFTNSRIGSPSSIAWLYLLAEFFIGVLLSTMLTFLGVIKSILPKPPRDLTGNVVLVTGASSPLGRCLATEFIRVGCTIVCVDHDLELVRKTACELADNYSDSAIQSLSPDHRKQDDSEFKARVFAYQCDLWDRKSIRKVAQKVKDEIGPLDILVTCAGESNQNILDTVSNTLMSHYWTVLAFLPMMYRQQKAHIVGVTPTASTDDAYLGTRAAIAGLMESLGHEFGSRCGNLNFMTVAPKADPRLMRQSEEKVAYDVVQAVRRDQCCLSASWWSTMLYRVSCAIHKIITIVTRWIYTHGCDDL